MKASGITGSFVSQDQLKTITEKTQRGKVPQQKSEEQAEAVQNNVEQDKAKEDGGQEIPSAQDEMKKYIVALQERIGVELDEKDFEDYIFRGRVTKKVKISGGKVRVDGVFQTLTPKEIQEVEQLMAHAKSTRQLTDDGYKNERTLLLLSRVWLEINGRPLPADIEKRREAISKMGSHLVDMASEALNSLETLIKIGMREDELLKKR